MWNKNEYVRILEIPQIIAVELWILRYLHLKLLRPDCRGNGNDDFFTTLIFSNSVQVHKFSVIITACNCYYYCLYKDKAKLTIHIGICINFISKQKKCVIP